LVNQVIHISNVSVLAEGFRLAKQLQLDPLTVESALLRSSGSSRMLERFGGAISGRSMQETVFAARLAAKDLNNALSVNADLNHAHIAQLELHRSVDAGYSDSNFTVLTNHPLHPPVATAAQMGFHNEE